MNNVFGFRDQLINEYSSFSRSFSRIAARDIKDEVERQYADGRYWPEPRASIGRDRPSALGHFARHETALGQCTAPALLDASP